MDPVVTPLVTPSLPEMAVHWVLLLLVVAQQLVADILAWQRLPLTATMQLVLAALLQPAAALGVMASTPVPLSPRLLGAQPCMSGTCPW
jgi:hypothetical protein